MRLPLLGALLFLPLLAAAAPVKLTPGSPVPAFSRPGLDGKTVDLKAFRGKVMLIDFWASWCAPCLTAMPGLIALQKTHGPAGLQVVGISMDDSAAPAQAVMKRFAFNYPLLLGDAKLGAQFGGVLGLPVQMLVGRDGRIIHVWTGEVPAQDIEKAVRTATAR